MHSMELHPHTFLRLVAVASLLVGCDESSPVEDAPDDFRVQLDRQINNYEVSLAPSGPQAAVERARGAIHVTSRYSDGTPKLAPDNTTSIRHTCGAILIAPSYIVTAAHCVDHLDIPDPSTDTVQLEMYRPKSWLNWMPATVLSTVGDWFDFTHPQMTFGYETDTYTCELKVRCGDDWGPQIECNYPNADTALLRCDGTPGSDHGVVNIADTDIDNASVFMPWAHEVYEIDGAPGDGLWYDHYTDYVFGMQNNIHYFGDGRNQLLPLRSIGRWVGDLFIDNKKQGYNHELGIRWTDLVGCHGTSGSPVFQWNTATQGYEFLGPISRGIFKQESVGNGVNESRQLCQEPTLHPYGEPSLGYSKLEHTKHVATYADDCKWGLYKGPFFHLFCFKNAIKTHWPELWFPWDEIEACPACGILEALLPQHEPYFRFAGEPLELPLGLEPGAEYRLSADVLNLAGEGSVLVRGRGRQAFAALELDGETEGGVAALTGVFTADESGSITISGSEGLSISRIALARVESVNDFGKMIDREGVGLISDPDVGAVPMRFEGGDEGGFAALLQQGERMVMTREALQPNQSLHVSFSVNVDEGAFSVGLVMPNGEEISTEAYVEDGTVSVELESVEGAPAALAIDLLEGPEQVAIDDVLIVGG